MGHRIVRLVTWNCCRGPFEAKAQALAPLNPDIAIIQEAPRPEGKDTPERLWLGGASRVGIAVLARNGYTVARASRPTSVTDPVRAVRVSGPVDFNLLAIWARADSKYIRGLYDRMQNHVRFARKRPTYYFQWSEAKPFHIDYCFVPQAWRPLVRSVDIGGYEAWSSLSDHRPVTVELALE